MKALATLLLFSVIACGEEDPARHLPDAQVAEPGKSQLVVTKEGTGSGTVTSTPAGISCGDTCTADYEQGTAVTLIAEAAADSTFTGWSGACSGDATTCDVTLDAAANVTATFALKTYTVTLAKAGPGTGTITGDGTECTSNCTLTVTHGTHLSLSATPTNLSVFAGWGGACTNATGTCDVTVTSDLNISASFVLDNFTLTAAHGGNGSGTMTSSPTGISCGTNCSHTFTANQTVTMSASAATGSTFTGWSGAGCNGTGTCMVTIDSSKTVTGTFTLKKYALTVTKVGSGTVTSNPAGISCGATCTHDFDYNATTPVTLSATPASGYTFTGFTGACTGMTCSVLMTAARNVTATFTPLYKVTITKSGTGAGTVSGSGFNCGTTCTQTVTAGTQITLSAAASTALATQSTFMGWSGGCTGFAGCTVTVNSDLTIDASFHLDPNIMFVASKFYTGDLMGIDGADAECKARASAGGLKGTYRAYLSYKKDPNTLVNAPDRFVGASGWTGVNGKAVMETIDQFHKGTVFSAPYLTEDNVDVSQSLAWTGTSPEGVFHSECEIVGAFGPWAGTGGTAMVGIVGVASPKAVATDTAPCGGERHLYCLGIDRKASVQ